MVIKLFFCTLLVFLISTGFQESSATQFRVKKDLTPEWLIFTGDGYQPFAGDPVSTIYFNLQAGVFPGDFLSISGHTRSVHIFINGKLAGGGKELFLNIDSLSHLYSTTMLIGIHEEAISPEQLITQIRTPLPSGLPSGIDIEKRKSSSFRDFSIVAALVLVLLLTIIIRLNPKLASDYFSVTKIFSLYEGEDSQSYSRITSSINILFYVFCSLMLSYYLMIVFQFVAGRYPLALSFQAENFSLSIVHWLEISAILLLLFFLKIMLVYGLSQLFGLQGIAGIHFFNWVRLLVVIFGAATVILSVYFIGRGQSESFFSALFKFLSWALVAWMILILLKLRGRTDRSLFHLFSYICATELIPFLFIIKILYN